MTHPDTANQEHHYRQLQGAQSQLADDLSQRENLLGRCCYY